MAAAKRVASTIATSNLVKTALFGEDANWGRVMGAIGRSGVPVNPDRVTVRFDKVVMVKRGMGTGLAAERKIAQVFKQKEFTISVDLGQGRGTQPTCGRPTCRTTMFASTQAIDPEHEFTPNRLKIHCSCDSVPRL